VSISSSRLEGHALKLLSILDPHSLPGQLRLVKLPRLDGKR
jgi:hypothetical protein